MKKALILILAGLLAISLSSCSLLGDTETTAEMKKSGGLEVKEYNDSDVGVVDFGELSAEPSEKGTEASPSGETGTQEKGPGEETTSSATGETGSVGNGGANTETGWGKLVPIS